MRYPRLVFLLVLASLLWSAQAAYIDIAAFPYASVVHGPPTPDSPAGQAEFAVLLALQEYRGPDDVRRLREDSLLDLNLEFAEVLGDWFVNADLPLSLKLIADVMHDINGVNRLAKEHWCRLRPYAQNGQIKPCVRLPTNQSYPSGHTSVGLAQGLVLAELCPDLQAAILARARRIGRGRVEAGVHFPSDVRDATLLAEAVYRTISTTPQFQQDLAAARVEVARARGVEGSLSGQRSRDLR